MTTRALGALAAVGVPARALQVAGRTATLWLPLDGWGAGIDPSGATGLATPGIHAMDTSPVQTIGRAARALTGLADVRVEQFRLIPMAEGLRGPAVSLRRRDLERAASGGGSPEELLLGTGFAPAADLPPPGAAGPAGLLRDLAVNWGRPVETAITLRLATSFQEPEQPVIARATMDIDQRWRPLAGLALEGGLRLNLADNFDRLRYQPAGLRTPGRGDAPLFARLARVRNHRLAASATAHLGNALYGRLAGGLLDEGYCGVGGALLWRPWAARWAFGIDGWQAWKRDPFDPLGLPDTRPDHPGRFTGFATAYYQPPGLPGLTASLAAGRFAGGDAGAVLGLRRRLPGGAELSGEAILSVDDYAQPNRHQDVDRMASFRLGLRLPLTALASWVPPITADLSSQALARDHGQRLETGPDLFAITDALSYGRLLADWSQLLD